MKETPIIPEIVQQFADDSAFLAMQRNQAHQRDSETLADLMVLENRLHAHLNGLKVSGKACWPFLEDNLSFEEYGEFFSATHFSASRDMQEEFDSIYELAEPQPHLVNAMVDALIWIHSDNINALLSRLYSSENPNLQALVIRVLSECRKISMEQLSLAFKSEEKPILLASVLAAAENGFNPLHDLIKPLMDHDDEDIQFYAAWSAIRFSDAAAMERLKSFVNHPQFGDSALQYVCMQKDSQNTIDLLKTLYQDEATILLAIKGLAYLGNVKSIPSLMELMEQDELAKAAGNAFSFITGVDLLAQGLYINKAEEDENESENETLVDLPWPDKNKIQHWWQINHNRFDLNKRYFLGQEWSTQQFKFALKSGRQQQRAYAALCLAVYQPGKAMFNVCAPVKRQIANFNLV